MAIVIQPVANPAATAPTTPVTPAPDLIAQLAQTDLVAAPDTSVVVTLGTGEPATLIYNANGVIQQVLFDLAPTAAAIASAGQDLAAQAAAINPVSTTTETPTLTPANIGAVLATLTTQATAANETPVTSNNVVNTTTNSPFVLPGVVGETVNDLSLTVLQAANQDFAEALSQSISPLNEGFIALPDTATLLAENTQIPAPPTVNVTPAPTTATAAQLALNAAVEATTTTTATTAQQAFATIPTSVTTENLLQNLLVQATNQALTTISSDPSYANSLTALLLSSSTSRVRMVDETGALLTTPEPVGPITPVMASKAIG
ncbi:TetR family transcriptional regulator [Novimethylophilus kurashikiensis]|uniref:TetR family transcriptional regulator n=1 Tax=Novimethylophilus kurashikiensis TaxID=1825523 RepID=A0A2R5F8W7_9PROT|nr:hypothetical protein [Novimethylophilus kurashikiensis]GBG14637.1 TetR family transcriptional regulator [Novimethylophilus kurashikiensis]